ncbi:putative luciferase (plasmid) [Phenylobacterium zucineum HLK1]|uniref:Putative luciferase n=1 Tax=Phenylobacterium zucineum (strain HLK1) TaxID=450851 RepID=B4RIQ7_PHEZH|nr:putative luciferase [Phenylobacterium zucineum HLK1]
MPEAGHLHPRERGAADLPGHGASRPSTPAPRSRRGHEVRPRSARGVRGGGAGSSPRRRYLPCHAVRPAGGGLRAADPQVFALRRAALRDPYRIAAAALHATSPAARNASWSGRGAPHLLGHGVDRPSEKVGRREVVDEPVRPVGVLVGPGREVLQRQLQTRAEIVGRDLRRRLSAYEGGVLRVDLGRQVDGAGEGLQLAFGRQARKQVQHRAGGRGVGVGPLFSDGASDAQRMIDADGRQGFADSHETLVVPRLAARLGPVLGHASLALPHLRLDVAGGREDPHHAEAPIENLGLDQPRKLPLEVGVADLLGVKSLQVASEAKGQGVGLKARRGLSAALQVEQQFVDEQLAQLLAAAGAGAQEGGAPMQLRDGRKIGVDVAIPARRIALDRRVRRGLVRKPSPDRVAAGLGQRRDQATPVGLRCRRLARRAQVALQVMPVLEAAGLGDRQLTFRQRIDEAALVEETVQRLGALLCAFQGGIHVRNPSARPGSKRAARLLRPASGCWSQCVDLVGPGVLRQGSGHADDRRRST